MSSRRELEAERDQLLARANEWDSRIKQTETRGAEDFIAPPIGCCGIYFGIFVAGSLILSAVGLNASKQYVTTVAAIAVAASLIGVVVIIRRREARRRERIAALERGRTADRDLREERLREIETELGAISD